MKNEASKMKNENEKKNRKEQRRMKIEKSTMQNQKMKHVSNIKSSSFYIASNMKTWNKSKIKNETFDWIQSLSFEPLKASMTEMKKVSKIDFVILSFLFFENLFVLNAKTTRK